jgi:hypothetical protein
MASFHLAKLAKSPDSIADFRYSDASSSSSITGRKSVGEDTSPPPIEGRRGK